MIELFIIDNGGRPYKVQIVNNNRIDVYRLEYNQYNYFRSWKNIENVYYGEGSVVFMLYNPQKEHDEGLKEFIHIYGSSITKYAFPANDNIKKYYSQIGNSDVVYSYMTTENGHIYVFDVTLVILKNQNLSFDIENQELFWNWYYTHVSVGTMKKTLYTYKY
jgi:hypothetical protein